MMRLAALGLTALLAVPAGANEMSWMLEACDATRGIVLLDRGAPGIAYPVQKGLFGEYLLIETPVMGAYTPDGDKLETIWRVNKVSIVRAEHGYAPEPLPMQTGWMAQNTPSSEVKQGCKEISLDGATWLDVTEEDCARAAAYVGPDPVFTCALAHGSSEPMPLGAQVLQKSMAAGEPIGFVIKSALVFALGAPVRAPGGAVMGFVIDRHPSDGYWAYSVLPVERMMPIVDSAIAKYEQTFMNDR